MTDDFKIEKGIPLPEKKTAKNSKAYEFIKSLEVGDSFVVKKDKSGRPLESKANSYVQVGKKLGKKLVTRKIYSEENPNDFYIRIWFTEEIEPVTKKYKRKRIYTSDVANPDKIKSSRAGLKNFPAPVSTLIFFMLSFSAFSISLLIILIPLPFFLNLSATLIDLNSP